MIKTLTAAAVIGVVVLGTTALAQVRDASYRGTLICGKVPFVRSPARSAIEVSIDGSSAKYTHAVIISGRAVAGTETGTGTVDDGKINLKGAWKGDKHEFSATYGGSFVRRSAKLTGVQIWTHEGKTQKRECTGAIKRPLPAKAVAVGVSRGVPRGKANYGRLRALEPGPWFSSVSPEQYLTRYRKILDGLDPGAIRDQLLSHGDVPVMLCWEKAHECHSGKVWCHRHLAAQWLEDRLGIEVKEVGFPDLDRFAYLRNLDIAAPSYRTRSRTPIAKRDLR